MSKIEHVFKELKKANKKALIPYVMAGDPSLEATANIVLALERAGADMVELGVPFSDPLADGPTIQQAAQRSLQSGTTLRKVLALVRDIRKHSEIPLILMTYYNPVFKFGIEPFIKSAVHSGVDGIIIPDLIPDEADDFIEPARKHGLDTIFLLAPTSTLDRIKKVIASSTGFIYYVSITGITGSQLTVAKDMRKPITSIQNKTRKPVAVGFGISKPEEASVVAKLADGVIVGSAIVKLIAQGRNINNFIKSLRKAI
jgi:tryptophan synthase alpha chain